MGRKVVEDGGQSSNVILVRVGGDDDVEGLDPAVPKIGRNDIFSDIQIRFSGFPELQQPSAVDQHARASGKHQQQAIALADVDGG